MAAMTEQERFDRDALITWADDGGPVYEAPIASATPSKPLPTRKQADTTGDDDLRARALPDAA